MSFSFVFSFCFCYVFSLPDVLFQLFVLYCAFLALLRPTKPRYLELVVCSSFHWLAGVFFWGQMAQA